MSAENIIKRINQDAEQQIKHIKKEAERQKRQRVTQGKQEAEQKATQLLTEGKQNAENHKKIRISQASQEIKKEQMNTREQIIESCFIKAQQYLEYLTGNAYHDVLKQLLTQGSQKIPGKPKILIARKTDETYIQKLGYRIAGHTKGSGGIILQSKDETVTVDNTFEGILKRKKDEIRIKIGKLLFSNNG